MITSRTAALVAVTVLALPAFTPTVAGAEALRWHECVRIDHVPMEKLACATLRVPLDYADPAGRTIEIEISRRVADPGARRGVLLMNPGGPGSPALPMPLQFEEIDGAADVLRAYDLIGFDPRGVGRSTPVTCDLAEDQRSVSIAPYPRDRADVERQAARVAPIAAQCGASATAELLPHMTTLNTARDMDRIRAALGEERISFYGTSYGSYLGAVYASLFPWRTDRVVLDSVLGRTGLAVRAHRRFAAGFDDRFPDFAEWAARRHETFGLGRTPREVTATFFELAARPDTGPALRMSTFTKLYSDTDFPSLAEVWRGQPRMSGDYPDLENHAAAQLHMLCNDSDWPEDVEVYQRAVERERHARPMFGPAAANVHPCAFWPAEPVEPPVVIGGRGPSNILLVQNLRDPATPLEGARELRAALGSRAAMVTVDQGGHGVLHANPNRCGSEAALRFLTDGSRPVDRFCPSEPR